MSYVTGLKCLRCGTSFDEKPMIRGCPLCAKEGIASSLSVTYDYNAIAKKFNRSKLKSREPYMWRYTELLPVDPPHIITMKEGNTPLISSGRLGASIGIANLYFKDESRNPTWSFKDRLGSVVVSKALEFGAKVITDSSTGNQGATSAAHAAKAGIPAVIFTHQYSPKSMHILMRIYGAHLIVTQKPEDRGVLLREGVKRYGWFPTCNIADPPVGSSPWGVEGYKTIAYEICEQLGWRVPQVVVFPTDIGDGITGMFKGFNEFIQLGLVDGPAPRMISVERFGALSNALNKGLENPEHVPTGPSVTLSIATSISSFQALYTLRASGGTSLTVEDDEVMEAQSKMAVNESLFVEPSSAAAYAGLEKAKRSGLILEDDTVVMVITSSGLKTPNEPISYLGLDKCPVISANSDNMLEILGKEYGFNPEEHIWDQR